MNLIAKLQMQAQAKEEKKADIKQVK